MRKFGKLIVDILGIAAPLMPVALAMLLGSLVLLMPAQSHSPTVEPSAPIASAPVALPECMTEPGEGMALCTYAGSYGDIVSGDCAPDYVGSAEASEACVILHGVPATTVTHEDGSQSIMPDGKALIDECMQIQMVAEADVDAATELHNDGWTVTECFLAQMES